MFKQPIGFMLILA
jgi:hypothetical protein